jgi:hypothetical protein
MFLGLIMTDTDSSPEVDGEFIVEKILKKRIRNKKVSFKMKTKNLT